MKIDNTEITVCVALPTYNREAVLVKTLEQVLKQDPPADQVLVIDQTEAHEPDTEAYLRDAHRTGSIRWIKQSPPNLNKARNRALAETKCEVLVLIDDDVELVEGFFQKHARNYLDPRVEAVCGKVIQAKGNIPPKRQCPWLSQFPCNRYNGWGDTRVEGIANFWGCNHSLRVQTAREMGGFDENFFGALLNESDLALRMWQNGKLIVYDPEAALFHRQEEGGVRATKGQRQPEYWMSYSTLYFHLKHFFPGSYFWKQALFIQLRHRALRREVVFRPWRIPWALISYTYAFCLAAKAVMRGPRYALFADQIGD